MHLTFLTIRRTKPKSSIRIELNLLELNSDLFKNKKIQIIYALGN